ncbi:two-component system response regulator CreB [Desulfoluna spongiiphila]|uniref:Two component transcriptional regulator, winged helix family n=1 Tax=Desulfoluna spongiiphila TaxID=419481 RepID=A0A1G5GZU4_9BACT|nr:two-component system response regulator CreB [Desulfoluna spongiiphila]SCY57113.1 two component transcriptional regulator, winged helix family [Desulfoluna spongiiphila]
MDSLVLIVEDEPAIAENIRYALTTEGFETLWQTEGVGVLKLLEERRVDLIVLDIGLPDINGMELCKAIRKNHTVPIIFLTARSHEVDRIVGLEIGADDYMVKPFSPRELAARVKAILRRTAVATAPPQKIKGDQLFQVDESRLKISYFSTPLDLSRYEYRMLSLFISRPGQIFSRDRLMERVWDEPGMSMDRTVDVHIKNIRAKLKKIRPDMDPIRTHRGIGYSLKETS